MLVFGYSLLEHNLPDSPFASPKATGDYSTAFSDTAAGEAVGKSVVVPLEPANNHLITSSLLPATSTLDMAPFKSCYFQVPRYFFFPSTFLEINIAFSVLCIIYSAKVMISGSLIAMEPLECRAHLGFSFL